MGLVALASLSCSPLISQQGKPQPGRQVHVLRRGGSSANAADHVSVYAQSAGTSTLVAAGVSGTVQTDSHGNVPGFVTSGVPVDVYDALSGQTDQVEPVSASQVVLSIKEFFVAGAVAVPSGNSNVIPPGFVTIPNGGSLSLVAVRRIIQAGTSATFSVMRNGAAVTGWTNLTATPSAQSSAPTSPVAVADGDVIAPVVTAVSGSPYNMSVQLEFA